MINLSYPALNAARDTSIDYPADFLAFSTIVYLVVRPNVYKFPIPSLLKIIARDATYYFLVIFSSHVVFVLTLLFAKVSVLSFFPPRFAKIPVARNPAAPRPVSDATAYFTRLLTGSFPMP